MVHWTFDDEMWKEYTRKEYAEEISEKKGLFVIVSVFALFFGFLFWFLDNEAGFFVFLVMLGLIGLVGFAWRFSAWYYREQNERGVKEAYTWRLFSANLLGVEIKNSGGLSFLKFSYTAFTVPGPQTYTIRVPIPTGQEEVAKTIIQQLNS